MKHIDAHRSVIEFIEDHWDDGSELEIITGNSKHMQGMVINVLDEYKMTYQVSRLYEPNNRGYLVTWT